VAGEAKTLVIPDALDTTVVAAATLPVEVWAKSAATEELLNNVAPTAFVSTAVCAFLVCIRYCG